MSNDDNSNPSIMDNITDKTVPLDQNNLALKWDGNPARILGLLHEIWLYYVRVGLFLTS